jgi:formate dehydrogenase subunit delta
MHSDNLVRMANQIGSFFEAMPDRAEAQRGAAQHLKSFWEPRMRRALLAQIDTPRGAATLTPFMRQAIAEHRALVEAVARADSR